MSPNQQTTAVQWIKCFTPPVLITGKDWIISFYAFDPAAGRLRRKRIRVTPRIKSVRERKLYAREMMERIELQLRQGWNPWIEFKAEKCYATWQEAVDAYRNMLAKLKAEKLLREKTVYGYLKYLEGFEDWNRKQPQPIYYAYQCDYKLLVRFTDWLWLEKGRSVRTRDNYVVWLKIFGKFLKQRMFSETNPAEDLQALAGKKAAGKNRTIIPAQQMTKLKNLCEEENRHYLLACYILYYCFVRPKEMSFIQIKHISIKKGTLFIPDYSSKNGKDGTVTVPDCVMKLMLSLKVFDYPGDYYLFSDHMMPGQKYRTAKQFSDYWDTVVRRKLHFPKEWKFYSLKDTGITDLIRADADLLSVRNQARHHSLLMTDIYTPHDIAEANDIIKLHKSDF